MLARRLSEGDRVGIVAPSSPVTVETRVQLEKGISFLGGLGLEAVVGKHVHSTTLGYCASPEEKAEDINEMFADHSIAGIICAQGGTPSSAAHRPTKAEAKMAGPEPQDREPAGELCVFPATGKADRLSGRYLHILDNITELVQRADAILADDLYALRLRE